MKKLFSASEIANACGVSRMTIRRLCDKGLLTTANSAEAGEVKLFDYTQIIRLERILQLERCGVTQKEMMEYLNHPGNYIALVKNIKEKYYALEQLIMELELYSNAREHISINEEMIPPLTLYTKTKTINSSYDDVVEFLADAMADAVKEKKKLKLTSSLYLYSEVSERILESHHDMLYEYTAGVLVDDEETGDNIMKVESGKALSMLWYGKFPKERSYLKAMRDEMKRRNYEPRGDIFCAFICDSGLEYVLSEEQSLVKFLLPIKETEKE